MKALYGYLIGIVLVLMVAPLAAGDRAFPSWDKQINGSGRFKVLGDQRPAPPPPLLCTPAPPAPLARTGTGFLTQ